MSDSPLRLEALRRLLTPITCTDTCHDIAHTWTPSCFGGWFSVFSSVMFESFKIYPPLYLVAALLRREQFDYYIKRFFFDILRSSATIAVNGSFFVGWCCIVRQILGRFYFLSMGFVPGVFSSFMAINVERKERRGILALYMFNLAIEMIYNVLKKRGYIIPIPYGEVWIFCATTSIMMHLFRREDGLKKGIIKSLIRFFIGTKGPESVNSRYHLAVDCIKHSLKAFTVGYILQVLPSLPRVLRKPSALPKILYNPDNFSCGMFLGSYVGIFKVVEYSLALYRKRQDNYNTLIAGGLSGLSMMFYRSSSIALYLATKIAETMYKRGIAQGVLPAIPHATMLVYSISTALVFHSCAFEVDTVRPSYWKYLNQVTRGRFCEINRKRLGEVFKMDSDKLFPPEDLYMSLKRY